MCTFVASFAIMWPFVASSRPQRNISLKFQATSFATTRITGMTFGFRNGMCVDTFQGFAA